jgi:hypothetical protein
VVLCHGIALQGVRRAQPEQGLHLLRGVPPAPRRRAVGEGDRYYFDADAVLEMIEDHIAEGGTLEDIRLVVCEPSTPRHFEMADFLGDDLPEDFDAGKDFAEIDEVVNDWIRARTPFSWHPGKKAVSVDSLPRPDEHQEAPPDAR